MTRLLDLLVPASALRWGRLTSGAAEVLDLFQQRTALVRLPGGGAVRVTRNLCDDAGVDFDALKAREDPTA